MGRITAISFIRNATTKVMLTVFLVLAGLALASIVMSYRTHIGAATEQEFTRLAGITIPLARAIDAEGHERLTVQHADGGTLFNGPDSATYAALRAHLVQAHADHALGSDVYTMVKDPVSGEFKFIVTSGPNPYFKHVWEQPHQEHIEQYESGASIGPYTDENGTWLSVFRPIKLNGRTVAIVQADKQFDPFLAEVRSGFRRTLVAYTAIFILAAALLLRWMHRILKHEDTMKERLQRTAEMLREKNDDIMASLRAAERLQRSVMPDHQVVREAFPEFGVLFMPKDLVSGDLYWYEHVGQRAYLAVGDCTGHGIPGAMTSMLAASALRTALLKHEGRLDLMLDALDRDVRKQWHQEDDRSAGMDITLCCIDFAEGRFTYASAGRPLLLLRGGQVHKLDADRAGIGGFQEGHRYCEREVTVRAGDRFYLYSDGFVDQMGGERGKKFKNEQLFSLLPTIQGLGLTEQMTLLRRSFTEWKGNQPQIDDVIVLGFEIPDSAAFANRSDAQKRA
ncbi:MAG: serine/threonine-protein phosphatase [Flavobacteriales bacterium]|nr:serine/threonine-protein phosphatase [Flavobacteriales bacterium]